MDLDELQKLSENKKISAKQYSLKRAAVTEVIKSTGREYLGLIGPRGAGKTVALLHIANSIKNSFYISIDTIPRGSNIFELLTKLEKAFKPSVFLLDEVHFNRDIDQALKNSYDFLNTKIVFSSSVALSMHKSSYDLSRRVRLIQVPYFSFAEYVYLEAEKVFEPLDFRNLAWENISSDMLSVEYLFADYLKKGICPFSREVTEFLPALKVIQDRILREDIPQVAPVTQDEIAELERLMKYIGRASAEGVNPSSISKNCGIPRTRAEKFLNLLEQAFLIQQVWPKPSTSVMREPKILLHPPIRLLFKDYEDALGSLREDYTTWALSQARVDFHYLKSKRGEKCPDFFIDDKKRPLVIEVGGKGKGRTQFKGLNQKYTKIILKHGAPYGESKLPLWVLGFLDSY